MLNPSKKQGNNSSSKIKASALGLKANNFEQNINKAMQELSPGRIP
jgi:hypothetical protein